jgi:hypothetical protein
MLLSSNKKHNQKGGELTMGQYYMPVNADNLQYLYTHDYGNGLKLMEHSYIGNNFMNVIERLLAPEGSWHKNRIVWAGGYASEGNFINLEKTAIDSDGVERKYKDFNLYDLVDLEGEKITPEAAPLGSSRKEIDELNQEKDESLLYVCNWTKNVYVDLTKVAPVSNSPELRIHPLSILTSDGNGLGSGDFRGYNDKTGTWAGDVISVEREAPLELNEITPNFREG